MVLRSRPLRGPPVPGEGGAPPRCGHAVPRATARHLPSARPALENRLAPLHRPPPPSSAADESAYATALNNALLPLFRNPDARVRLDAAIVAGRVAGRIGTPQFLAPAALAAVNDKAEPVVLWGVKAAYYIIPHQMDLPP